MDLRGNVRGWLGRPLGYIGSEWNRMAPRERRLVGGLVAAVVAFAVLVTGFLIVESLREIAESNDDAREALAAIAKHRDEYLEAKDRMMAQEARIGTEPPQFAADLEAAAHEVGIGIPETQEQPSAPAGHRYVEHKVEVKLRQVDLQSLSRFLNKLETGRRLIMVTSMRVRKRFSDQDKLDVDFSATAFERLKEGAKRRPTPAAKGGKP